MLLCRVCASDTIITDGGFFIIESMLIIQCSNNTNQPPSNCDDVTRASIKKKDLNLAAALLIMVSDSIHRDDICKISKLQDQERDSEWCACESWGIIFGAASSIRA